MTIMESTNTSGQVVRLQAIHNIYVYSTFVSAVMVTDDESIECVYSSCFIYSINGRMSKCELIKAYLLIRQWRLNFH